VVSTPSILLPLWTGAMKDDINQALVKHLLNPDEFWGTYPLPTVAKDDPKYDPETMWRGPVWANINYFFIEALRKTGNDGTAVELRDRTLDMIMAHDDIFEYYNPETGMPPPGASSAFGWTAAMFIDLAIQSSRESEQEKKAERSTQEK